MKNAIYFAKLFIHLFILVYTYTRWCIWWKRQQ